jgi:DNA-binding transcriptional LysR family regulator
MLAFDALVSERHVSRAAQRVGITQPAMSNALARLRLLFDDAILVRSGREMVLTVRAQALANPVRQAMNLLRQALDDPRSLASARTFVVGATEYAEALVLPALLRVSPFARASSGRLMVRRLPTLFQAPEDELQSGTLDLAIGFFPQAFAPRPGLHSQLLFGERSVCVAKKGRFAARSLSLRQYASLDHVAISYQYDAPSILDQELAAHGLTRRVVMQVPHLTTALWTVAREAVVTTLPKRFAVQFAPRFGLEYHHLPVKLKPVTLAMLWHSRTDADPELHSIRAHIATIAQDLVRRTGHHSSMGEG